eukprot:9488147-Pyramimonas_sp.AAC.1
MSSLDLAAALSDDDGAPPEAIAKKVDQRREDGDVKGQGGGDAGSRPPPLPSKPNAKQKPKPKTKACGYVDCENAAVDREAYCRFHLSALKAASEDAKRQGKASADKFKQIR